MWKKKNNFESDDSESQLNNNIFLNEYYNNIHNGSEINIQSTFANNSENAYLVYDTDKMTKISDILSIAKAKFCFMDTGNGCYKEIDSNYDFQIDAIEKTIIITDEIGTTTIQSFDTIGLNDLNNDIEFEGMDGSGFAIAILDTGIDLDHSFFGPDENNDGISDRIVYSYDFTDEGDNTANDEDGHGTNVSSIAASSDSQYAGVASGADIIALQVLTNGGGGTISGIENALNWLIDNAVEYNIVAVNMSIGWGWTSVDCTSSLSDELQTLKNMGVMVVVAAGNYYYEHQEEGVSGLAGEPSVISVGAVYDANVGPILYWNGAQDYTTDEDRITSFSYRSETMVDIFAPGALITAAGIGGGLSTAAGTSQAAPHIAGLVALAQEIAMRDLGRLLTQEEFVSLMVSTGTSIIDGDDEDDNVVNTEKTYEVVNVYEFAKAIKSLAEDVNDPLNLTVTPVSTLVEDSVNDGTIVATSSASDEDGGDIIYSIDDTTNYTINTTTGVVTLTASGAAIVNSGADLPAFNVTAQSTTGLTSSNTINVVPPVTTDVNDPLNLTVTPVTTLVEDSVNDGTIVATSSASDEDGGDIIYSIDDTTNYTINTTTGVITLTVSGAAIVNSGADLPAFNVTAQSTTGLTSSNTINVVPPVTTIVNNGMINGTDGDDIINGTDGDDIINGLAGNDIINGLAGNDIVEGGLGNDTINGGDGIDTLTYYSSSSYVNVNLSLTTAQNTVGAGIDTIINFENLIGSNYNDILTGNSLNNVLEGGLGNDTLDGGVGIDTVTYENSIVGVSVNLALTSEQTIQGTEKDTLIGIENLIGSNYDDILTGNSLANTINGGLGDDTIGGGAGKDILDGGDGMDAFVFDTGPSSSNVDTILNFNSSEDTIMLDNSIFTLLKTGPLSIYNFTSNSAGRAYDKNDYIVYENDTGKLFYDSDGVGWHLPVLIATLYTENMTPPVLTYENFTVI